MVRHVFNIVYKEVQGLHQAAYVLGGFAFGSQILALVRDRLLAHEFGAGALLDVYYASFRVPDLLYVLFASTLSVYVLVPFVAKARKDGGVEKAKKLLGNVFTLFLVAYSSVALLMLFLAPVILPKLFPGISDQTLLLDTTRILMLQPLFLGISSLFGVVTQLSHRFVLYAISPLIYNLGIIFGIGVLYPVLGLTGIAYGVILGACGHMLIQWPFVKKSDLSFKAAHMIDWAEIRSVLALSVPRAMTLSLNQIVLLILISFASVMSIGSVSVFQFAYNLQSVPLAIIGVSYSVAAFPLLAQLHARNEMEKFRSHIITALRHIIFWSVPIIALIVVLRAHLVRVVLGSGEFDWSDTRLTAAALAIMSLALVAQAVNLLVIRAFYAGGYTRIPFYATLIGAAVAALSAHLFYIFYLSHYDLQVWVVDIMRLSDVAGSEVLSIALGYTLAVVVQAVILVVAMRMVFSIDFSWLWWHFARCLMAGVFGAIAAYATLNFLVSGINPNTFIGVFIQGLLSGVTGVVGVILIYKALQSPELREIYQSFQRKLLRTDVVAPERDVI